jgi:hypothetical protein
VDRIDPAELASALLEDVSAKLPNKRAEIRILPARGLDLHHDVVLISDHAPVYIGTVAPKHSVWRVIKTAPNVGRSMRTQLHWHMPTKEECALRMAEVMRPYWKPIINNHGLEENEDVIDPKSFVKSAFGPLRSLADLRKYSDEQAFWCDDPRLMEEYGFTEPFKVWDVHWVGHGIVSGIFYHPDRTYSQTAVTPIMNLKPVIMESTKAEIEAEAEKAEKPASDEQAEAGNYKKGHVSVQGLDIAIENAKGSTRSGVNKAGESWKVTLPAHYGYIKGTVGKDKDHLDVYIGDNPGGMLVFVVNQQKEEGGFDEHKIMLGFASKDEAIATYDKAFTGDLGPKLRESVVSTTMDKLKEWIKSGNTKKPFESIAESIVDSLLENDDPKEMAMSIPPAPRFFGQLKPGMVTHDETGAYNRVERIERSYAMVNYQDENGKLVYDSGPGTVVYMAQFSPAYAYGRFKHVYPHNAKGALLGEEVVEVEDNSDDALWALVDAGIDQYHGPGTAAREREAHLERERQPEAQERAQAQARARAEIQRMMGGQDER